MTEETVVVDVPILRESVISLIIQSVEEFFRLGVFAYRVSAGLTRWILIQLQVILT